MLLAATLIALAAPAGAGAGQHAAPVSLESGDAIPGELLVRMRGQRFDRVISLPDGVDPGPALRALRRNPAVASASRDYVVRAAGADDPGTSGVPGGWRKDQWNLLASAGGINAPPAWKLLAERGRRFGRFGPDERGVTVAVVDSGIAYRYAKRGRFRRSPDFAKSLFTEEMRDFIDDDRRPLDLYGHGTHMAGTIAAGVRNGAGVRGIAPGVRVMPVRVLDKFGSGRTSTVARGVLWAADHGAEIINVSIEYGASLNDCSAVPALCRAFRRARRAGSLVVAAAGNYGRHPIPVPAGALVVGASTVRGCLAAYSNRGPSVDLLAPGGGRDADGSGDGCFPDRFQARSIVQLTLRTNGGKRFNRFGYPWTVGTSSAAAHASGVAALVVASGVVGPRPKPLGLSRRLTETGRPAVGLPPNIGTPPLLDAAAAVGAVPSQ